MANRMDFKGIDTFILDLETVFLENNPNVDKELYAYKTTYGLIDDDINKITELYNMITTYGNDDEEILRFKVDDNTYMLKDHVRDVFKILSKSKKIAYYANDLLEVLHDKGYKVYYMYNIKDVSSFFKIENRADINEFLDRFEGGITYCITGDNPLSLQTIIPITYRKLINDNNINEDTTMIIAPYKVIDYSGTHVGKYDKFSHSILKSLMNIEGASI